MYAGRGFRSFNTRKIGFGEVYDMSKSSYFPSRSLIITTMMTRSCVATRHLETRLITQHFLPEADSLRLTDLVNFRWKIDDMVRW